MALINKTNIATGNTIQAQDILNIVEALDGTSSSTTVIATGSFSGSLIGLANSASYALTASYALNAGGGTGAGFPFTGSAIVSGSLIVTGSTNISGGITGSLFGTASWANNAITASFATTLDPNREQTTKMYKSVGTASLSAATYTASLDLIQGTFYNVRATSNNITIHFTSSVVGHEYEFFVTDMTYSCSFEPASGVTMYSEDNYRKANKVGSSIVAKYIDTNQVALIGSLKP